MKTNPDSPINPNSGPWEEQFKGLTKREHFAIEALSALIINDFGGGRMERKDAVDIAVKLADDLIKRLNE